MRYCQMRASLIVLAADLAFLPFVPVAQAQVQAPECRPDCPCSIPMLFDAEALANGVSQSTLQRQYDLLRGMRLEWIEYLPQGPVSHIQGETGFVLPAEAANWKEGQEADAILPMLKDVLLANGTEQLKVREVREQGGSMRGILLTEHIRGIPVINGLVGVKYDTKTMRVASVVAHFVPDRDLPREPRISAAQAERAVPGEVIEPTFLGYFVKCCGPTLPKLVWAVSVWNNDHWIHYIDATAGVEVVRRRMSMN